MITEWNDKQLLKKARDAIEVATEKGAEDVAGTARRLVKKDTRDLEMSIEVKKSEFKDGGYIVEASGTKYHASFVELGTHKDPKQPFLRPALLQNKLKIQRHFQDAMK